MSLKAQICYVCTTPFQIMNAVSMCVTNKEVADLYIVPQFAGAESYFNRIKALNVFQVVSLINDDFVPYKRFSNKILIHLLLFWIYLRIKKFVKPILVPDSDYKSIFISSKALIGRLICLYHIRAKCNSSFFYFDDGEGSYDNPNLYLPRFWDSFLRKLFFGKRGVVLSQTMYLYSPELHSIINPSSTLTIHKISPWINNDYLLNIINFIADFDSQKRISENVILIDSIADETFDSENCKLYKRMCLKVNEFFGNDIIYKKHPRDKTTYDGANIKIYEYSSIPFEVLCANIDISNKVLIVAASTAVCTPKVLFNAEPYVVLMYKFVKCNQLAVKQDDYYQSIKNTYKDKSRFLIPESEQDFVDCLTRIRADIYGKG